MASAVTADRAWRDSAPEQVEQDLAALWRELSRRGPVARAVMSNLVVFRLHDRRSTPRDADAPTVDVELDAVIARHPSRTIVIEHDRGDHQMCAPIGARVAILVFGPAPARYAVEEIVVRSACAERSLPSIVRRFVRGDLPTSVWWTEDLSRVPPLAALIGMARQLVYDSRSWRDVGGGFRALTPVLASGRIDLADVNWRRLTPLRRLLVRALSADPRSIGIEEVRIIHRPGDGALAWLLAGWLASRLHWPAGSWPSISEARHGNDVVSVTIGTGPAAAVATLNSHRAMLRQAGAAPMAVEAPRDGDADAVAAELRTLSFEEALRDALTALTRTPGLSISPST